MNVKNGRKEYLKMKY